MHRMTNMRESSPTAIKEISAHNDHLFVTRSSAPFPPRGLSARGLPRQGRLEAPLRGRALPGPGPGCSLARAGSGAGKAAGASVPAGVGLEAGVDGVADLPLQAAQGLFAGLAFGQFLVVVGAARAVPVADLGDRGHVDGVVDPAVAAPGQPVDLPLARGNLDRGGAVPGGEVVW